MLLDSERVAARILDLARNPDVMPLDADEEEESTVEPDQEYPIDGGDVRLEPQQGTLLSSLQTVRERTVWAVDGGALSVELPIGRLIIGRAILIKMSFYGYETARRVLEVPALPFAVYGSPATDDVPQATSLYLSQAIRLIPSEIQRRETPGPRIEYFSDGEAYLDKFASSWSGATQSQAKMARAIDLARNAAETIAFQAALKLANPRDLILRDGRLHGSAGFWTTLCPKDNPPAEAVQSLESFIQDVRSAIRRDVRIVGIIKRPVANECTKWFRRNGLPIVLYSSDAILYMRACDQLLPPEVKFGKRSTLWRYKPYQPHKEQELTPRVKLEEFRRSTSFFYVMPGLNVSAFRVDMPTYDNKYRTWYEEVANQVYTLARGSGSPSRIPHPIVIADAWARVHRGEAMRLLYSLIAAFESSPDPEAKSLARELRAWIYRGR